MRSATDEPDIWSQFHGTTKTKTANSKNPARSASRRVGRQRWVAIYLPYRMEVVVDCREEHEKKTTNITCHHNSCPG